MINIGKSFFVIMSLIYHLNVQHLKLGDTREDKYISYHLNDTLYTLYFDSDTLRYIEKEKCLK